MKLVHISLVCLVLFYEVESTKLKICLPKKKKGLSDVSADITFEETFKEFSKIPEKFTIPLKIPFKFSNEVIRATGYAKTITLSNYMSFTVCVFQSLFEPMNITLNTLKIEGDEYNITGEVADIFDIYGNGKFEMNVEDYSFAVNDLAPTLPLGCVGVDLKIALRKLKAKFENLMNGDEILNPLFNKVIGDLGPDFIDFIWPPIYDFIEPYIQILLDKFINHKEMRNFIETSMSAGKKEPKCFSYPPKK